MNTPTLFPDIPQSPTPSPITRQQKFNDYDAFVEKFKPKKTTDDCYTPPYIYDTIKKWVNDNIISLDNRTIIRPFRPGGDYQAEDYPPGCIVLDNPPFSMLAKIRRWYNERAIPYFLFAPALTLFSLPLEGETYICADCGITYENGAVVKTSFITNLTPEVRIMIAGDLCKAVRQATSLHTASVTATHMRHSYPVEVITSALLGKICQRGITLKIAPSDCLFIRRLDNQQGTLYGGGYLLSERAAAERAAAERAAAEQNERHQWRLSEREQQIVSSLGRETQSEGSASNNSLAASLNDSPR